MGLSSGRSEESLRSCIFCIREICVPSRRAIPFHSSRPRQVSIHPLQSPIVADKSCSFNGWGVTVFDSLDTMLLMDLPEEFSRGLDLARSTNFTVQHVCAAALLRVPFEFANLDSTCQNASLPINSELSFFETIIRYLGGLLSAHALSHEPILLDKADELATALAPVFDTPTGLPYGGFHLLSYVPFLSSCSCGDSHARVPVVVSTTARLWGFWLKWRLVSWSMRISRD